MRWSGDWVGLWLGNWQGTEAPGGVLNAALFVAGTGYASFVPELSSAAPPVGVPPAGSGVVFPMRRFRPSLMPIQAFIDEEEETLLICGAI